VAVRCDPRKVKQILLNLVQNAIDASPLGGTVELSATRDRDRVVISVRDQGPGVPSEQMRRIFEPGVTTKANGSGLGLTIVRQLVEQHCGSIALDNRDGGGLEARVDLMVRCPSRPQEELA